MTTNYLQYFPKPLLSDLLSGRWLPIVGAGMSLNAKTPLGKKMPLWPDLGKALQDEFSEFSSNGTLDAISAYQHEFGRAKLIERLTEILLIKDAHPGVAHKSFCSIPFDIVCTTNFDFLLEHQYKVTPRYAYPVVDEEQLSVNGHNAGTLLLKLHGDLHHPSRLVVTEEDYDAFLGRYPLMATYLSNLLITKTGVLIGYSLDDPDFRQIWNIVSNRLGKMRRMAYSLMVNAKASDIARFERRGVKVINLPGTRERYGEILADTFDELREYMRDNVISVSKVTEEEPRRELMLPRNSTSRLCFFSVPVERLSVYRSRIFPIVEQVGFVPVTAEDVIAPGDNINAKIDALIDRAAVMVVELNSSWTWAELKMALAREKQSGDSLKQRPLEIIVVTSDKDELPAVPSSVRVITGFSIAHEETDEFIMQLVAELERIAKNQGIVLNAEAKRLFDAKEYRAAVISAISSFEMWLKKSMLDKDLTTKTSSRNMNSDEVHHRTLPIHILLNHAKNSNIIKKEDLESIILWLNIRNEAVHKNILIPKNMAKEVVEGISRIIQSKSS